jgi:hypothetical protein
LAIAFRGGCKGKQNRGNRLNFPWTSSAKEALLFVDNRRRDKGLLAVEIFKPARMRAFVGTSAGWFGA